MATGSNIHICAICKDTFKKPKIITCFHTFCLKCLEDFTKAEPRKTTFKCPLCRMEIQIPVGGVAKLSNNMYIPETCEEYKKIAEFCSKHKEKLKVFCRDCCKPLCTDCLLFHPTNHSKVDLIDVGEEANVELKYRLNELETHIQRNEKTSDKLNGHLSDITDSQTAACRNINVQAKKLCEEIWKQAEQLQDNIKTKCDIEREKLNSSLEVLESRNRGLKLSAEYAKRVLEDNSPVHTIDILPNVVHLLKDDCNLSNLDHVNVKYPYFPVPIGIRFQSIMQELGGLQMNEGPTFETQIDLRNLRPDKTYISSDIYIFQNLPWAVEVKKLPGQPTLGVYLGLKREANPAVRYCMAHSTLQLVNHGFRVLSITKKTEVPDKYIPGCNGFGWSFLDWEELNDQRTGFVVGNTIIIQATVRIVHVEKVKNTITNSSNPKHTQLNNSK